MANPVKRCISCGVPLTEPQDTTFSCPACGKTEIGRCTHCRIQSATYLCSECGFEGP